MRFNLICSPLYLQHIATLDFFSVFDDAIAAVFCERGRDWHYYLQHIATFDFFSVFNDAIAAVHS